jgi:hypothetical protein
LLVPHGRRAARRPADPSRGAAYASDFQLLATAIQPHGLSFHRGELKAASLDHALWFHGPFRADDWLLYVTDSPWSGLARGLRPRADLHPRRSAGRQRGAGRHAARSAAASDEGPAREGTHPFRREPAQPIESPESPIVHLLIAQTLMLRRITSLAVGHHRAEVVLALVCAVIDVRPRCSPRATARARAEQVLFPRLRRDRRGVEIVQRLVADVLNGDNAILAVACCVSDGRERSQRRCGRECKYLLHA